jgi:hypothetical protein
MVQHYAIAKRRSVGVVRRGGEVDAIFGFEKGGDALRPITQNQAANSAQRKDPDLDNRIGPVCWLMMQVHQPIADTCNDEQCGNAPQQNYWHFSSSSAPW